MNQNIQPTYSDCLKACKNAELASQKDLSTILMKIKFLENKISHAKKLIIYKRTQFKKYRFIPILNNLLKKRAMSYAKDFKDMLSSINSLKIEASGNKQDLINAKKITESFKEIIFPLNDNHYISNESKTKLNTIRIRVNFISNNDIHIKSRRRKALIEIESLHKNFTSLIEYIKTTPEKILENTPKITNSPELKMRSLSRAVGTHEKQISMDFSGNGKHSSVSRIWLPVPYSRMREMISMGARYDPEAPKRGSRIWIPIDETEKFESVLPLSFRSEVTRFSYPPIRHNAVGQNLGKVFDYESWSRIRNDAYDRSGHRCQICGKQYGKAWSKITSSEEQKKSGPIDCHEVWDWEDLDNGKGIQKLKRLLVLCKDCHLSFHEGFAMYKAREAGMESETKAYLEKIRMLTNRVNQEEMRQSISEDSAMWQSNKNVDTWILDLSHIGVQSIMQDHTLVLNPSNQAGVTPDMIGGVEFTLNGDKFENSSAKDLANGMMARLSYGNKSRLI